MAEASIKTLQAYVQKIMVLYTAYRCTHHVTNFVICLNCGTAYCQTCHPEGCACNTK